MPINLELRRHLGIPVNNKLCNFGVYCVKDEKHVLMSYLMCNGMHAIFVIFSFGFYFYF